MTLHCGGGGTQPQHLVLAVDTAAARVDGGRAQGEGEQHHEDPVEPPHLTVPDQHGDDDHERGPCSHELRLAYGAQRGRRPRQEYKESEKPHRGLGQGTEGHHQDRH